MTIHVTVAQVVGVLGSASAFLVIAGAELAALATGQHQLAGALLPLTMPALAWILALLWPVGRSVRLGTLMITAVTLSWAGDVAAPFGVKLGIFAAAHLAYAAGFWPYRRRIGAWPVALAVPAIVAAVAIGWGQPAPFAAALVGYAVLITITVLLATGVSQLAAIGGALFMASDLLVGSAAVHPAIASPPLSVLAIALYLAGQLLIVLGVLRAVHGRTFPHD